MSTLCTVGKKDLAPTNKSVKEKKEIVFFFFFALDT